MCGNVPESYSLSLQTVLPKTAVQLWKHPFSPDIGMKLKLNHESNGIGEPWHRNALCTSQSQNATYWLLCGECKGAHAFTIINRIQDLNVCSGSSNLGASVFFLSGSAGHPSMSQNESSTSCDTNAGSTTFCYCAS
jgi:hypothetical protein